MAAAAQLPSHAGELGVVQNRGSERTGKGKGAAAANHRRAGHAVTNILARELMQEDLPSSSKLTKKKKAEEIQEPQLEGSESLEELLEAAPSRSN
ncbi:hypothetical protein EXN66_Car009575 [Channa argus]|uniref:Uncharacterized protein n=1 Tax=Channa argus TaxID=215402 RepID=A0A6G1PUJ3_CHAAH|nr:hypothetical protein EXN66_Car009575 [Channa argus]